MAAAQVSQRKPRPGARRSARATNEADVVVGRNVRIRRMAKGLSQTQLAKTLGVTFQQVQKYEKGVNRIGAGRLARIAQALAVPLSALVEHTEADVQGAPLALIADRRALRLAHAFATIDDPAMRISLVELIEELARTEGRRRR